MSTGAIAAARMEDRHSALAMLEEAAEASRKAPKLVLSAGHVVTYQIGVSIILGDAGTVIEHARSIAPDDIPTLEGRASCYTGVAEAYTLWGKTGMARLSYRTVLRSLGDARTGGRIGGPVGKGDDGHGTPPDRM
jgi:hypothetical protein